MFFLGFISGALVMSGVLYVLYTGQWYRIPLWHFYDAAGLTTTSDDFIQIQGKTYKDKHRPKMRMLRLADGRFEFDLYPAWGKKLADYLDKTEEMAQALHAAAVTIESVGIGDHGHVIVYMTDPIPAKYSIDELYRHER